jgi:hypothetical protein
MINEFWRGNDVQAKANGFVWCIYPEGVIESTSHYRRILDPPKAKYSYTK